MSSSKQSFSGLGRVTRDWSAPSSSQSSSATVPLSSSLSNTQSSSSSNTTAGSSQSNARRALTGAEKRLQIIQAALEGRSAESELVLASSAVSNRALGRTTSGNVTDLTSGTTGQKRSATDNANPDAQAPPTKKRVLPPSFSNPAPSLKPGPPRTASGSKSVVSLDSTRPLKSSKPSKAAPVFLSQEQTRILKLVKERQSVFYTGSAGTGKSVLLREIIREMRKLHVKSPDAVAITASTGLAACNIGGVTIHSFAGIGLGAESVPDLIVKIRKNKKAMTRWLRTKVLIIDEVSMVEADLFDKLAQIASKLTGKSQPFGGIQLVVTGDFFQLPPVTKSGETKFAFEAQYWDSSIKRTFNLTKVFRQRDEDFITMLNEMRFGKLSSKSIAKFRSLSRELVYDDGIDATELFPRREEVERSNQTRMSRLGSETHTYRASHGGVLPPGDQREKLLANFMVPPEITLSVGAQVMLVKNMDEHLVNGSMGKVVRFIDPSAVPEEEYSAKNEGAGGKSGQKNGAQQPQVPKGVVWPVVSFSTPRGGPGLEMVVQPETWKVELPNGEVQVSRTQLPLILAWAMSIHKSQGQTLERVKVDLGKVFEKGQAYVALSRATSLEGLQVLNFDPNKVKAHPKVVTWCNTLEVLQDADE